MRFMLHAVSAAQFDRWLTLARGMPELTDHSYSELMRPSSNVGVRTFGRVDPELFAHILRTAAPLAPAPREH